MITVDYLRTMARYNTWQNGAIYRAADGLGDAERRRDRGAFFGSVQGTLNHLLWADRIWMSRFTDIDPPPGGVETSHSLFEDWAAMVEERPALDAIIQEWAGGLDEEILAGELTWYSSINRKSLTEPTAFVVAHIFNHQTHHRGQVHAMLTAAGATTEATDLLYMPKAG